jgi:hypothetical protein
VVAASRTPGRGSQRNHPKNRQTKQNHQVSPLIYSADEPSKFRCFKNIYVLIVPLDMEQQVNDVNSVEIIEHPLHARWETVSKYSPFNWPKSQRHGVEFEDHSCKNLAVAHNLENFICESLPSLLIYTSIYYYNRSTRRQTCLS